MKKFLYAVILSALVFAGCSDDDKDLIKEQEEEISALKADLEALKKANGDLEKISASLEEEKNRLEEEKNRLEEEKNSLKTENAELENQLGVLNSRIEQLENSLKACEASIEELKDYKSKLDKLLGEALEEDYTGLVKSVLEGLETLANVKALCAGDYGESTIKEYIDKAVGNLESSLGNYVLKKAFEEFEEGYYEFKNRIESAGYQTKTEVEALFTKETENFKKGVLDVVAELEFVEDEELQAALLKAIEDLGDTYAAKIDDLKKKVEKLEPQVAGLLGRIQSLVYVPKTADGKIHIGTSYVSAVDEKTGAEKEPKIELATTKKLEYRVSPASLRDYLLLYKDEVTFSFYQAHVSREGAKTASLPQQGFRLVQPDPATRAETREGHDGLNEFNVVKVEAGNDEGTLLITVDNEHDFTHEDLAVALCIKQDNTETGVLTEYTSGYTTVIGEGANLISRFYLAKKEADGTYSKVSRTDRIDYTLVYDDTTPVEFMQGYEVVYDDGETVMSLEEAKEKYEWNSALTGTIKRGGKEFLGTWTSGYTITPQDYQTNKQAPLTFQIKSESAKPDIIGKSWGCNYTVEISDGVDSVPIIPEFNAYVTILPKEYVVEAGITWNSGKWYGGKTGGWHSAGAAYTSSKAVVKYKVDGDGDATASTLPSHIKQEIFSDKNPWTVSDYVSEDFLIDALEVTVATNIQDLAFTVKGYKYNKGTHTAKISRSDSKGIPTSGTETIKVTGTLTFEGPADKDLQVAIGSTDKPVVMSTKPEDYKGYGNGSSYALLYMQTTATFIPEDKVLPLDKKFFTDGVSMLVYATVKVDDVSCTKSEGGDENAPQTLKLMYYDKPGGRPSPLTRSVNVDDNEKKITSIQQETTYTFEKGFDIVINEGPTITVTNGTFKFVPAPAE
jgi:outer membrane murein-binding lipoprotein Lpp